MAGISSALGLRISHLRFWRTHGQWYYLPIGLICLVSHTLAQPPPGALVWELQVAGGTIPDVSALDHCACVFMATSSMPVSVHYFWCGDTGANRTLCPRAPSPVPDVEQAFLHGVLDDVVMYIRLPALYPCPFDHVLKLLQAVYGLHQAPPKFKKEVTEWLKMQGYTAANDSDSVDLS